LLDERISESVRGNFGTIRSEAVISDTSKNGAKDWTAVELSDLKQCAKMGLTLEAATVLLGRDLLEVATEVVPVV
jgi:hypothetical protein